MWGDLENDTASGGRDQVFGGSGRDEIHGGGGRDLLYGEGQADSLYGDGGDDVLVGGSDVDQVFGGAGSDVIQWAAGDGGDTVDGGAGDGRDKLELRAAAERSADRVNLGARGDGRVALQFNDADLIVGDVEQLSVDLGEGGDRMTVADLRATALENIDVDYGTGEILESLPVTEQVLASVTPVDADGDGFQDVFAAGGARPGHYDADTKVRTEQQVAQSFKRQVGGSGAVYLYNADGSPSLVRVTPADGSPGYWLQEREGVAADDGGYTLEDFETRNEVVIVERQQVFAVSDPYGDDQIPGQAFQRQVGGGEAVYLYNADGSPRLVTTVAGALLQLREGVDPDDSGYALEDFETRIQQRSRQVELPVWAMDSNGKVLLDSDGNAVQAVDEASGEPLTDVFITPEYGLDSQPDVLEILGSAGADGFDVASDAGETLLISQRDGLSFSVTNSNVLSDELIIETLDGDDEVDASGVRADMLAMLHLHGGAGDDRLTGSPFVDHIDGGLGDDIVSGGAGVDVFDDGGGRDTLWELRDADFFLSDRQLVVSTLAPAVVAADGGVSREVRVVEDEDIKGLFEVVELSAVDTAGAGGEDPGTASVNRFTVRDFTATAYLDGGDGPDVYDITLSGTEAAEIDSLIDVRDRGPFGLDSLTVWGTAADDTFSFRRDLVERITPREGLSPDSPLFSPVTDFSTEIVIRDTRIGDDIFRQQVNYLSAELFTVHGRAGDDLFLVDDSSTELEVYGDGGDDRFFIGNVLATELYDHPKYGLIEIVKEITNGVSFPATFYGGTGDDYFEVNHNLAEISLYGEDDDDTFYLKAHLILDNQNSANIAPSDDINVYSEEGEQDTLAYLKNAPVNIFGGAGFDTLAIVGTEVDDTFVIFVEEVAGREVQRIYGAGLVVPQIESIERLLIITGGGDDTVYLYGTLADQEISINTGAGNDTVYVGGDALDFEVVIPEAKYTKQVRIPQPPLVSEETFLISPATVWYEKRWQVDFRTVFGIPVRLYPYYERIERPAVYGTRTIETPQPDKILPVVVTVPEYPLPVVVPETRSLNGIQGPVIIDGASRNNILTADGVDTGVAGDNRLIIDNSAGVATGDDALRKQRVEVVKFDSDVTRIADQLPDWMDEEVTAASLDRLIANLHEIRRPGLVDELLALSGGETTALTLRAGTLVDLLDGSELVAELGGPQVVLPQAPDALADYLGDNLAASAARDDLMAQLRALPVDQSRVVMDPDTGEVRVYSTVDVALEIPAGYVLGKDVKNTKNYDTVAGLGSGFGIFYENISAVDLYLGGAADRFTIEDTAARAVTRVYGGGGGDEIQVHDSSGPLELHGDTHPGYSESHRDHLPELGALLGLAGDFDPEDVDQLRELARRLNAEAGTAIDVDAIRLAVNFDAEAYNEHLMALVRLNVNALPDAGTYMDELARTGEMLGLGGAFDAQNLDHLRSLAQRLNDEFANIDIDPNADLETLAAAIDAYPEPIWTLLKRQFNTIQPGAHYSAYRAEVRAVLGLDHDFDPALVDDVKALASRLVAEYKLPINIERIALAPTLKLDDYRQEIWQLLLDEGRVAVPAGDDRFILAGHDGTVDTLDAPIAVFGQQGADFLQLVDSADSVANRLELTESTIGGLGMLNGVDYQGLERLEIRFGSGDDVANVRGTSAATTLDLGAGDERIYVASQAALGLNETTDFLRGDLDALVGDLTIAAGSGRHLLMVSDEASTAGDGDVTWSATAITGLAAGDIDYDSAADGDFAAGITVWSGSGADHIQVSGSHLREGVRTTSTLNSGAGDDRVEIDLAAGRDGFFVLNTQGGDDRVDASASSLPLIIFGGLGADDIRGGSGDDVIFGDRGRVEYRDATGRVTARLGAGGAGDFGDGVRRPIGGIATVASLAGGSDTLDGGAGDNVLLGGEGNDRLATGDGDSVLLGGDGVVRFDEAGQPIEVENLRDETASAAVPRTQQHLEDDDTIVAGDGANIVLGGAGNDTMTTGAGNDVILGDRGTVDLSAAALRVATGPDGDGGNDRIDSGGGDDVVLGGMGDDRILGGAGNDVLLGDYGSLRSQGGLLLQVASSEPRSGGADRLAGQGGDDVLLGGAGGDELLGGAGRDLLIGDSGLVIYSSGVMRTAETNALFTGGPDTLDGGAGNDFLLGGFASDRMSGNLDDDILVGEYGKLTFSANNKVVSLVTLAQGPLDFTRSTLFSLYNTSEVELYGPQSASQQAQLQLAENPVRVVSFDEHGRMTSGQVMLGEAAEEASAGPSLATVTSSSAARRALAPQPASQPASPAAHYQVQVQAGDSLWNIAARELGSGYLWPEIQRLNPQLNDPDVIIPGELLTLPSFHKYRIQAGDSLWSIAARLLGDPLRWPEIQRLNPQLADPDLVRPGEVLNLPADALTEQGAADDTQDRAQENVPAGAGLAAAVAYTTAVGVSRQQRRPRREAFLLDAVGGLRPCYDAGSPVESEQCRYTVLDLADAAVPGANLQDVTVDWRAVYCEGSA